MSQHTGMIVGAATVLIYTMWGGMWSVAVTDFLQMIVILVGMVYIAFEVSGMVGGVGAVLSHASAAGKFNLLPAPELKEMLWFLAAWITMMFGSIPQQDVFQRVASSKNERIAGSASITGGVLYFCFAFIPMFLAYSATLIDPKMVARPDRHRSAADPADPDHAARAGVRAGDVLRRAAVGDQELRQRDPARALGHLHREHPARRVQALDRPPVPVRDARGGAAASPRW